MIACDAADRDQIEALRARLAEAEELLRAIRLGEIDALVVEGPAGHQVYTLHSAEEPYRTLVEQMQEGAVVLTAGGDILYANARFAALVGERSSPSWAAESTDSCTCPTAPISRRSLAPAADDAAAA
jgi:PAS domain-containing protein